MFKLSKQNEKVQIGVKGVYANTYVTLLEKDRAINTIIDSVFAVERDDDNNIVNYEFKQNDFVKELLFVYSVGKLYLIDVDFPQLNEEDDILETYDSLMSSGIYRKLREEICDIDVFEELLEQKIITFKNYYIDDNDSSELNYKLTKFITIYEDKLQAETKELELKNKQSEKFIDMMPDDIDKMQVDVEQMISMAQKLNGLENFDIIKKLK